MLEKTAVK